MNHQPKDRIALAIGSLLLGLIAVGILWLALASIPTPADCPSHAVCQQLNNHNQHEETQP